jgi:hypothetical protein
MAKKKTIDYSPLLEHEWNEALNIVETVKSRIPENMAGSVWYLHNKILGTNERQPCTCASSGALWGKAYNTIKEFVSRVNG